MNNEGSLIIKIDGLFPFAEIQCVVETIHENLLQLYILIGVTLLNIYLHHFGAAIRSFNSFCNNLNRIDLLKENCLHKPFKKYHWCLDLIIYYNIYFYIVHTKCVLHVTYAIFLYVIV